MKITGFLTLGAATMAASVLLMALAERPGAAEDVDLGARAKHAWHHTCQRCHTAPDATYETGRAFLAQITETS